MIEYALLVMLGFCAAGLLALLIAPTIWRRAVRLTTKRLDATLPMSLSDIEADKDLLRASYAIQIRRLEAGLNKARDKSASQLVEISKLQMVIGEFRDKVTALEKQLEERSNAANVFERTIKKRFPELEAALSAAKAALDERAYEISDLNNSIRRKEEALSLVQRSSSLQQGEIRKLRETLEGTSADRTGRFKKRPAQWSLEEFRSEYDRLNLELSKMREQLALSQERESGQVAVLRTELQNLAEQIMTAAAAQEKQMAEQRAAAAAAPAPEPRAETPRPGRRAPAERPMPVPQPWPRSTERSAQNPADEATPASSARVENTGTAAARSEEARRPAPERAAGPRAPEPKRPEPERPASRPEPKRPSITSEASPAGAKPETAALKTLLDRAAALAPKETGSTNPAADSIAGTPHGPLPDAKPRQTSSAAPAAVAQPVTAQARAEPAAAPSASAPAKSGEPNIDRMLREIFEGKTPPGQAAPAEAIPPAAVAPAPAPATDAADRASPPPGDATPKDKPEQEVEGEKKQSLIERLRVV